MIAQGTEAEHVTPEQIRQIADDVSTFIAHHKISRKELAEKTGWGSGTVTDFLNGTYKAHGGQIAIDLDDWLCAEEAARVRPQVTQYFPTNVAEEMQAVVGYCLEERTIGLVYGPKTSGMGKSTALTAIAQTMGPRQAAMVTFDKVDANITGVLKKISAALRVSDTGTNKQRFDRVVKKISTDDRRGTDQTGRRFILLLDQIHNLRDSKDHKPFYVLTDLHDATRTAQLWVGTADIAHYLKIQQDKVDDESLAQIKRRIYPQVDLVEALSSPGYGGSPGHPVVVTAEQFRGIFARSKLRITPAAVRAAVNLCNEPDGGSIGLVVQCVKYATMVAEMTNKKEIDVELLKQALARGLTHARAENLMNRVEETTGSRMSMAG
jgi:energy-coupling factor transporter ATP-binding protein EcfA2